MKVTVNAEKGTATILAEYTSTKRLKIKILKGKQEIFYDIVDQVIAPLTFGKGTYKFILYEQVIDNRYTQKRTITKKINIDESVYQLSSNDIVKFSEESNFYNKALELETFNNILKYVTRFGYDFITAMKDAKKAFGPPDIEMCFTKKLGTCYSLSALFVAMLRICGISAALVVGKADGHAHAWAELDGKIYDILSIINKKTPKKYIATCYY